GVPRREKALMAPPTAEAIKARARELGADLVGIADGKVMDAHPPDPRDPRRPSDVTALDAGRVIVMAKRVSAGSTRILAWNDRHKYYNDELALTLLETASLELVYWLEDRGFPRSEEHTSELQSRFDLVCRLLLEKKK